MNFGMGNKLQDEINPTGQDDRYFSRQNFEMLFWTSTILIIISIFSDVNYLVESNPFLLIGFPLFFLILSKLFR